MSLFNKQHKFNKKFIINTFGFTFISDDTKDIRDGLFYNLICAQGLASPKFLFICPPDRISIKQIDEYNEKLEFTAFIQSPIKDINAITKFIEDDYSVFIYDLRTCFEQNIITPTLYEEYISFASDYFIESHHIKHIGFLTPLYKGLQPPIRYVTDVTGLDKPIYSAKYPKKLILDKIIKDEKETKTYLTIPDPCHEFYLYDDTPEEIQKNEELFKNLVGLTIKLDNFGNTNGDEYETIRPSQENKS